MKVFFNKGPQVRADLEETGAECYMPMHTVIEDRGGRRHKTVRPLVSSLLFFRCSPDRVSEMIAAARSRAMIYTRSDGATRVPAPIPDREMQIFRIVTSGEAEGLEFFDDTPNRFRTGRPVRVTAGPFAGAEGHIVRIRGDRRLVVSIRGVCAVATTYIPQCFLETI